MLVFLNARYKDNQQSFFNIPPTLALRFNTGSGIHSFHLHYERLVEKFHSKLTLPVIPFIIVAILRVQHVPTVFIVVLENALPVFKCADDAHDVDNFAFKKHTFTTGKIVFASPLHHKKPCGRFSAHVHTNEIGAS